MNTHSRPPKQSLRTSPEARPTGPIFGSRKIHAAPASHPAIRVPFREITLSDRDEPGVRVYDSSGPYTEAEARVDLDQGLASVRETWLAARGFDAVAGRAV